MDLNDFNIDFEQSCNVDFDYDFNGLNLSNNEAGWGFGNRYNVPNLKGEGPKQVMYEYAEQLANDINLREHSRYDVIVSGNFVFGDFIEAFLRQTPCKATEMWISTLSLNQENVDSLSNLMERGYIDRLNLIISVYFFGMNRKTAISYILEKLDKDDRFQLAVAGIHTKTVAFQTLGGRKIAMHGSANLRSSGSVEQFCIEENADVFDFYSNYCKKIVDKYAVINKAINHSLLWSEIKK